MPVSPDVKQHDTSKQPRRGSNQLDDLRFSDVSLSSFTVESEAKEAEREVLIDELFDAAKLGDLDRVRHLCGAQGIDPDVRGFMGW